MVEKQKTGIKKNEKHESKVIQEPFLHGLISYFTISGLL